MYHLLDRFPARTGPSTLVPRVTSLTCTPKAKAWITFSMQEVKGSGNIPHHSAGFQLIEVLPLLDVG